MQLFPFWNWMIETQIKVSRWLSFSGGPGRIWSLSFPALVGSTQVPESLTSASRFVLPDSASQVLQDPCDDRGIPSAEFLLLNNV